MGTFKYFVALMLMSSAAQAANLETLKLGEKIAFTLTGKPLTDELRTKLMSDTITLEQVADNLTKSNDFIESMAAYYTNVLHIQSGVQVYSMGVPFRNKNASQGTTRIKIGDPLYKWNKFTNADLQREYNNLDKSIPRLKPKNCKTFGILFWQNFNTEIGPLDSAAEEGILQTREGSRPEVRVVAGTEPMWKRLRDLFKGTSSGCNIEETIAVTPWWDSGMSANSKWVEDGYRARPDLVKRCGGVTLPKCDLYENPELTNYFTEVGKDLAMEAGYIVSHTIAEDRPFSEILTTEDTILTGTVGNFLNIFGSKIPDGNGGFENFWEASTGKTIKDISHPIFSTAKVGDRTHYRIKRNNLHAGVLTTPVFQLVTNGNRAKANRAYEAFLCKKFVVPDGAKPDPTDANPDLTKRTYCAFCHKSLEPMASFFNRWPVVGDVRFHYNGGKVEDAGLFNGEKGNDVPAFAKIMANHQDFGACAVQRAFEFVNGRKMTSIEASNRMPTYLGAYTQSSGNLRPVLKLMLLEPSFLHPGVKP